MSNNPKGDNEDDFCDQILRRAAGRPVTCIIDVGANVGNTVRHFLHRFPVARIVAIEPVVTTFSALLGNVGSSPRVCCMNLALGPQPGRALLHHQAHSGLNSLHTPINIPDPATGTREEVTITTLDQIVFGNHLERIDLLKLDTEHFEMDILQGAERALKERRISSVYAEVSFDPSDRRHTSFDLLRRSLEQDEFEFVGCYEHAFHPQSGRPEYCNALFCLRSPLRLDR